MTKPPRLVSVIYFVKSNKYPLLVTLGFFLSMSYVSIFHHQYWTESDGIFYLSVGEQILNGDGQNVKLFGTSVGGPVLFATLNLIFQDGFVVVKTISILSGTGIVLFSYYIIRNIFNSKVALVGQLFFAFNPFLHYLSIQALHELLPIFLISISLYFITKKNLKLSDVIITGALLGGAFMIRHQALLVAVAILIFLLIRNMQIRINISYSALAVAFFITAASPVLVYDYSTHGTLLDNAPNFYLLEASKYQTPEWHDKMTGLVEEGVLSGIFLDFNLFLKNYFYNLFYHNSSLLFNFNSLANISIIQLVPFLGIIPVIGGLIYSLKLRLNKINITVLVATSLLTTVLVFFIGDISIHFFAIIIIPLLSIGILNIRSIEKNLLPLLILSVVYFSIVSIIPSYRIFHLFPMWITVVTLSAVFFVQVIPKLLSKIRSDIEPTRGAKATSAVLILLILLINVVVSYTLLQYSLYEGDTFSRDIKTEFYKLFQKQEPRRPAGLELKEIGDILSRQPGIENSYVMANIMMPAYYANSKFVFTDFQAGLENDTLDKWVNRENWTEYDLYIANVNSIPSDRYNLNKPKPDYLVYQQLEHDPNTTWYVKHTKYKDLSFLADPNSPEIPSNFEVLYQSNRTGIVVYKINHNDK